MFKKKQDPSDRRKFIRLDTVFPVEFRLFSIDRKRVLSQELQGFTNNIGKGGICLVVNNLRSDFAKLLLEKQAKLSINIELPISGKLLPALVQVAWMEPAADRHSKYIIGLNYEQINPVHNIMIMRYAWTKKLFLPVAFSAVAVLISALFISGYVNVRLFEGNKALVDQLVKIVQDSSVAKQKIKEINREKEDLELKIGSLESKIQAAQEERDNLSKSMDSGGSAVQEKIESFRLLLNELLKDKSFLQDELISLQHREGAITEELLRLDKKKATLTKANIDKMYRWLKVHQNPRTGLVISFEGDGDIKDVAFIYDQALVLQSYNYFSDYERLRKALNFFQEKAERKDGLFFNAYYAHDGSVAEYKVNSGPNIWLGISILQYVFKAKDYTYLPLVEEIAERIIAMQDENGGVRGGPNLDWYSTEHNLDAYAFFNMFYQLTKKEEYLRARKEIENWLLQHTYDNPDVPIKRGKGDSTIATDTYAWSLASLGPEKLEELGMNPDRIIEFVEQNCVVKAQFMRPEGEILEVEGFDFASQRNLSRAGVVSTEWTAQMIIALKIMAKHYYNKGLKAKAHSYEMKADEYMSGLSNMIISSPSASGQGESCLPYATQDFVDTGHGWMTPKGKSTGSTAATAYTLFAYYNYNPLDLEK